MYEQYGFMAFTIATLSMSAATFIGYEVTRARQKEIRKKRSKLKRASEILAGHNIPYAPAVARDFVSYKKRFPNLSNEAIVTNIRGKQLQERIKH
jgi:hypothetical protein